LDIGGEADTAGDLQLEGAAGIDSTPTCELAIGRRRPGPGVEQPERRQALVGTTDRVVDDDIGDELG
jgi:hypothetical protein